jgi:hypothetical protein
VVTAQDERRHGVAGQSGCTLLARNAVEGPLTAPPLDAALSASGRVRARARGHVALPGQAPGSGGRVKPADGCLVDPVAFGDRPEAFTGFAPVDGFLLLMVVELGFSAELGAALNGGVVG